MSVQSWNRGMEALVLVFMKAFKPSLPLIQHTPMNLHFSRPFSDTFFTTHPPSRTSAFHVQMYTFLTHTPLTQPPPILHTDQTPTPDSSSLTAHPSSSIPLLVHSHPLPSLKHLAPFLPPSLITPLHLILSSQYLYVVGGGLVGVEGREGEQVVP